jgi:hypothetical protein
MHVAGHQAAHVRPADRDAVGEFLNGDALFGDPLFEVHVEDSISL